MATETHTGLLIFSEGQVTTDDGTLLAVPGPNPCATAAARFAKWGQTQPVTVTGTPGFVDNSAVLYVTSIEWAGAPLQIPTLAAVGDTSSDTPAPTPPPTPTPAAATPKKSAKKSKKTAANQSARSRSSN